MIRTLELSKGFQPALGIVKVKGEDVEYPAGEVSIKLTGTDNIKGNTFVIRTRLNSPSDIIRLVMAANALKEQGATTIKAFIPYFPYSRQDRVCQKGEAFSLKVICDTLESSSVDEITTYDAHSNVIATLFEERHGIRCIKFRNNSNVLEVGAMIERKKLRGKDIILVCPDQGASKKTQGILDALPIFKGTVYCNKIRKLTGNIEYIPLRENLKGKIPFVVDDICDGGATFIALAEQLKLCEAEKPHLFVSHGVFSKGINVLLEHYESIGTTNSISNEMPEHKRLHVFKLKA
jgi:ribose-phosphate pyrophosphokinase